MTKEFITDVTLWEKDDYINNTKQRIIEFRGDGFGDFEEKIKNPTIDMILDYRLVLFRKIEICEEYISKKRLDVANHLLNTLDLSFYYVYGFHSKEINKICNLIKTQIIKPDKSWIKLVLCFEEMNLEEENRLCDIVLNFINNLSAEDKSWFI